MHWLQILYLVASMGSTGGGGSSSGGSFSGGSGDDNPIIAAVWLVFLVGTLVIAYIIRPLMFSQAWTDLKDRFILYCCSPGGTTWGKWLAPGMTIDKFEQMTSGRGSHWETKPLDESLVHRLGHTYAEAQFYYSASIRNTLAGNGSYRTVLRSLLDRRYLVAMDYEINKKARHGIVDDVVINHYQMKKWQYLDNAKRLLAVQIIAYGHDDEVAYTDNFDDSFKREKWSDYVIFRRMHDGHWKIANIIYGEYFHLDGQDLNHQKGLIDAPYAEHNFQRSNRWLKIAEDYHRKWKRYVIISIVIYLVLLALTAISYSALNAWMIHSANHLIGGLSGGAQVAIVMAVSMALLILFWLGLY